MNQSTLLMKAFSILAFVGVTHAFEKIAGYEPQTLVTSSNAIDLDQREISQQLALGSLQSYGQAYNVYDRGAFSDPIAVLKLGAPLTNPLSAGDTVIGYSTGGVNEVKGTVIDNFPKGNLVIQVAYDINEIQANYVTCQVGGNPNPKTEGCFATEGNLIVSGLSGPVSYNYDILKDNVNGITIRGFTTQAREKMYLCKNCPYDDFEKFISYYGEFDYVDQWIEAALDAATTDFDNGNADFRKYTNPGKSEAIAKGTVYLAIWMYVIRDMENALDVCEAQDPKDTGVHSWDEAVAFYTGSLEGSSGAGDGVLMYDLADKRCTDFNTCGKNGDSTLGTSYVNNEVINEFKLGQRNLIYGDCVGTRENKERIVRLMLIPLIQGTLRYGHLQWTQVDTGEKAESEGATLAAAVLPYVHDCIKDDATTIFKNMGAGHEQATDFPAVKAAFERNYECMGITCSDVGGIWDFVNLKYMDKSGPCGIAVETKGLNNPGLAVGLAMGGAIFLAIVVILATFCGEQAAPPPNVEAQVKSETAQIS